MVIFARREENKKPPPQIERPRQREVIVVTSASDSDTRVDSRGRRRAPGDSEIGASEAPMEVTPMAHSSHSLAILLLKRSYKRRKGEVSSARPHRLISILD